MHKISREKRWSPKVSPWPIQSVMRPRGIPTETKTPLLITISKRAELSCPRQPQAAVSKPPHMAGMARNSNGLRNVRDLKPLTLADVGEGWSNRSSTPSPNFRLAVATTLKRPTPENTSSNGNCWRLLEKPSAIVFVWVVLCALTLLGSPNFEWGTELGSTPYGADFLQEWVGARMLLTGHSSELYQSEAFQAWQHDPSVIGFSWDLDQFYPAVYPPIHYAFYTLLACIPYRLAAAVWVALLWAAVLASAKLITEIAANSFSPDLSDQQPIRDRLRYIWLALVFFPPVHFSIILGQKSVLWLLVLCVVCRLLQMRRELTAGCVFAVFAVKPTLFFLLPVLMLRQGRFRFCAGITLGMLGLFGLGTLSIPLDTWIDYFHAIGDPSEYANNSGYRLDWSCNVIAIANALPLGFVTWGKFALCLPIAVYVGLCVFQHRLNPTSPEFFLVAIAGTALLSPHAYHYDLCLLMLPILWTFADRPQASVAYYALLSVAIAISPNLVDFLGFPIVAILLIGILSEIRLRNWAANQLETPFCKNKMNVSTFANKLYSPHIDA